jgi:hypothetical protein
MIIFCKTLSDCSPVRILECEDFWHCKSCKFWHQYSTWIETAVKDLLQCTVKYFINTLFNSIRVIMAGNADMSTSSNRTKTFVQCCHGKHTVASSRTLLSDHVRLFSPVCYEICMKKLTAAVSGMHIGISRKGLLHRIDFQYNFSWAQKQSPRRQESA